MIKPKRSRLRLSFLILVFLTLQAGIPAAVIAESEKTTRMKPVNPVAKVWRKAREGVAGYSSVKGQETNVLIQGSGQNWRQLRNGPLATYAGWLLGITAFGIASFYLIRGQVKLVKPRSGRMLKRWSLGERSLHWYAAVLFILLSVTGMSLLYGRAFLIPLLGKNSFAAYAEIAKLLHNFLGPAFVLGLLLMLGLWFKDNLPSLTDFRWIVEFGGLIGKKHPSAGRMNAGEKIWFWLLATAGIAVCVSGLILDFPNFGQDRFVIQIAHITHLILGMVLIVGALGHIYIGTIGTEGAFEGMISGQVDETWAEQHHDLWCEELKHETESDTAISINAEPNADP